MSRWPVWRTYLWLQIRVGVECLDHSLQNWLQHGVHYGCVSTIQCRCQKEYYQQGILSFHLYLDRALFGDDQHRGRQMQAVGRRIPSQLQQWSEPEARLLWSGGRSQIQAERIGIGSSSSRSHLDKKEHNKFKYQLSPMGLGQKLYKSFLFRTSETQVPLLWDRALSLCLFVYSLRTPISFNKD